MADRAALSLVPAISAGFVAVLVGYTSSAPIVFEAARSLGADAALIGAWMVALGLGMGVTTIGLSLATRAPILTAWSTPGAALIASSAMGLTLPQAIGAFLASGVLLAVAGFSGRFDRLMRHLPAPLAAAMLAGILLRFGLDAFSALATQPMLVGSMLLVYLVARRLTPRFAIPLVLATGIGLSAAGGSASLDLASLHLVAPRFTMPEFSWFAILGLGLPLFVVTMASQNVPGMATLRANGYDTPAGPLVGWTGAATTILAPFGGYALNLAAITAAICMGPQADPDPQRRYRAAVAAGVFYLLLGALGAAAATLLTALPRELVVAVAGLALIGTIGNALAGALSDESMREAAAITFLVTASGLTLAGVGSAFWGLVAGLLARAVFAWHRSGRR